MVRAVTEELQVPSKVLCHNHAEVARGEVEEVFLLSKALILYRQERNSIRSAHFFLNYRLHPTRSARENQQT